MDPQIVYGLAFADMELGDNRAGEGAIRVLEIEAPEELRGLESHVLRALPERVTFLRWSLQGHHVICLLRSLGSRHLRLGLPAFGRSLLNVDAEPPVGQLSHLLQVGSSAYAYGRMVAPIAYG